MGTQSVPIFYNFMKNHLLFIYRPKKYTKRRASTVEPPRYKPPRRRRGTVEDGGGGILHEQRNGVSIKTPPSKPSVLPPPLLGEASAPRNGTVS